MPTYEFRCPDGHVFDRFYRKISDSVSELQCPECGKIATRQLSGGAGLVFKGSGFYVTDYGRNAHRGNGSSHASSSSNGKSESKSDSKSGDTKSGESKSAAPSADSKSSAAPSNSSGSSGTKSDK